MTTPSKNVITLAKICVFAVCLLPLAMLIWDVVLEALGPDPVAQLEHRSGDWALRFLLITLAVTPVRRLSGLMVLLRFRRMLGLFAFFYASIHLAIYLVIDLGGFWREIFIEIVKRPYITVGFSAWLLLIPLVVTSTKGMMRRLGRRWSQLHRLVYVIALLGVVHYLWLVKSGQKIAVREPLVYLAIWGVLMLARLPWSRWLGSKRKPNPAPLQTQPPS